MHVIAPKLPSLKLQTIFRLKNKLQKLSSCFYQLRSISKIRSFLSGPDLENVTHAFISSRLNYCNSLYSGLNQKTISCLRLVPNTAARLFTKTTRQHHIAPVAASLHWLSVSFRTDFKILLITFNALHGLVPSHIADLVLPYESECSL